MHYVACRGSMRRKTTSLTVLPVRKELRERGSYIESEDGFLTMPLSLTKWVLLQQSGAEGGSYGHKHTQYFCKGQRTAKDHSREHIHLKWAS